jgi:hypothetical protein
LDAAKARAVERKRVAAAARAQRIADAKARAAERKAAEQAATESSNSGGGGGAQYAGLNCTEIGHSFTVTPGSDPEHDRDGDGIACESQ